MTDYEGVTIGTCSGCGKVTGLGTPPTRSNGKNKGQAGEHEDNRAKVQHISELFAETDEELTWLVDDMLPLPGFSMLAGKPKAGKSCLSRQLCMHVARGLDFLGRKTTPGTVLYYAFVEEIRSRVKRHFRLMGTTAEDPLYVYTWGTIIEVVQKVKADVERYKPVLIVLDPLYKAMQGVHDENAYIQVGRALEPLIMLARDTGAHVLVTHHGRKFEGGDVGDSVLGSTSFFGSVDTLLVMKKLKSGRRTVETVQRYGEDLPETVLDYDKAREYATVRCTREEAEVEDIGTRIVEYLATQTEAVAEPEIMAGTEGRHAHKRKALRKLVEGGRIKRQGSGGKGDPFLYERGEN